MKPYASYKPSGVPWLGAVPAHWAGKRLRDCVEGCSNGVWGDDPDGGDDDIPVIRVADFDRGSRQVVGYETLRKVDSGQRGGRALVRGDMLMEKSGGGEQQPVGMVVSYFGPEGAVCSNFVARMRSREGVVSRFMVYLHAYLYASRVTNISVKQTTGIQNLDSTAYLSEACFVPPPDEQQAIADYLDVETARIDTLIHEKDGLIGLLREWRQSVIAEAVTKGLDKTAAMKPSGVPWLGNLPKSWDEAQIRHVTSRVTDGAHVSPDTSSPDMPFVSTVDIKNENIDFDNCLGTTSASYEIMKRTGCKPFKGDVLFSKDGTIGRTCVVDYEREFVVASSLVIISPETDVIESRYLSYWLNNSLLKQHYELLLAGAALRRISIEKVSRLPVFIPTTSEQQAIADHLDSETAKIDDLIAHTHDEITLLKELRAATIADAVLGRIDVRDSARTTAACA